MGNLGATLDEISWVSTGYIIANVIVIPMSGWLSAYFGRKRYLTGLDPAVRRRVVLLRRGDVARRADLLARHAGNRRRRAAVHGAVDAVRGVPARRSRHRPGDVRRRRDGRPDDRPDARRLDRRQLQLAVDLLHQRAARHHRGDHGRRRTCTTPSIRSAPTRSTCSGILLLALCVGSLQWMLERGERYDWFDSRFVTVLGVTSLVSFVAAHLARAHDRRADHQLPRAEEPAARRRREHSPRCSGSRSTARSSCCRSSCSSCTG